MTDAQQRLFKAKISVALLEELRRRPTDDELQRYMRVLCNAVTGPQLLQRHPTHDHHQTTHL